MSEKRLAIIATKGTLDWAYPPLILASTAAALGYEVKVFCTFYGLQLLRRKPRLRLSALGNPGLPMPLAMDRWLPVFVLALPGVQALMTALMKRRMRVRGIVGIEELRALCLEAGVEFIACQMTVDLFGLSAPDFIDEVTYAGASTFLEFAGRSDLNLYV